MKLLSDGDTLLLLISCQNPVHEIDSDMKHTRFISLNPLTFLITNSDLICHIGTITCAHLFGLTFDEAVYFLS
jgi:hypothetical protein